MGENQPSSSRLLRLIFMSVAIAKGCQAIITNGPKIVKFLLHFPPPSNKEKERDVGWCKIRNGPSLPSCVIQLAMQPLLN